MKNRQLMRLNKVLHKGEVKTVDCISPGHISFIEDRHGEDKWGEWLDLDEAEFIPLTEEWLLKFGFDPCREGSTVLQKVIAYSDESYPCSLQVSGSGIQICRSGVGTICPNIEYVHQLQNLYFTLTGEELVIKDGL